MERKLVKQGRNAITMTLPSNWVKKNNLTQNDVVEIREEKSELIISSKKGKERRTIEVDITNMARGLAFHLVTGKYIEGYDRIIVKHNNFSLSQEIGNGFLGMIIEDHNDVILIMKDIINVPEDNFVQIFKRSCQLLIEQARTLEKQINKNAKYIDVKREELLLDNNLFYCLRYINKYEKIENSYKYFLLTTTIESVGDYISEISKYIDNNKKIKEDDKKEIENIKKVIELYVVYLFENNLKKTYSLLKEFKDNLQKNSFISGLCYAIIESLYNYIGYLVEK